MKNKKSQKYLYSRALPLKLNPVANLIECHAAPHILGKQLNFCLEFELTNAG